MATLTIPVSLCIYDDISLTVYPVKTGYNPEKTYNELNNAYIAGVRNNRGKIIGAGIFISSISNPKSDDLRDAAAGIFKNHKVTESLMRQAVSIPVGKLNVNLEHGTIEDAFSEGELNMVYADFYMKNSISGNA
nr:hypothetical protein VW1_00017 [Enterobacter sp.]